MAMHRRDLLLARFTSDVSDNCSRDSVAHTETAGPGDFARPAQVKRRVLSLASAPVSECADGIRAGSGTAATDRRESVSRSLRRSAPPPAPLTTAAKVFRGPRS